MSHLDNFPELQAFIVVEQTLGPKGVTLSSTLNPDVEAELMGQAQG
jgi:hypothetical protein